MTLSTYIARSRKAAVVGLTLAAVGASSAQASRPVPDSVDRYLANRASHMLAPDDRPGIRSVRSEAAQADAIDRYLANREQQRSVSPISSDEGFDWRGARIGAASACAVSLLAGCGLLLTRRRQHA